MVTIEDAIQLEKKYANEKFKEKSDFVDIDTRNAFKSKSVPILIIKCLYKFNYYSL